MNELDSLLKFTAFTHLANKVERVARTPGVNRCANTVEHSYQLTLLAWYVLEKEKLSLNKDLVIQYAIIHDLVEAYAGDTYIHDQAGRETKEKREREAQERIEAEFPEFTDLHKLIKAYEAKNDPEARFVYALDKLVDPINIYMDDGKLWHEKQIDLQDVLNSKTEKIHTDPVVTKYFEQLIVLLKEKENILFPKK